MAPLQAPLSSMVFYLLLLILIHRPTLVTADGRGLLGLGKWLYKPFCAHACRAVIKDRHKCLLTDSAFLRTLALCIAKRCPRDGVTIPVIEEYWYGHIATGTIGNWEVHPLMSYQEALRNAQDDVERVGEGSVPYVRKGKSLNATSFIRKEDWVLEYNARRHLERSERDHGRNAISIAITSVFLPVLLSVLRLLPRRPLWYSRLAASLEQPLVGRRHRTPIADLAIMPTRGQALYIAYLIAAQVFFCTFPLVYVHPNSLVPTRKQHFFLVIGDRTGVIAVANLLGLLVFSSRNNILLWITNWRHSTFLLIHRWIGYFLILEVSIHSLLLFLLHLDEHAIESRQPPWIWGVVGSLAFLLLFPTSILPIRKRVYELFLVFHQVFAALALVATFLHIYHLYRYAWSEIWVYVGGGVWFLDRMFRFVRIASNGRRRAIVSAVDEDAGGVATEGHVYLYFPMLSWKFWENHPYSVLSSFVSVGESRGGGNNDKAEKVSVSTHSLEPPRTNPRTTLLVKTMDGFTRTLAGRVRASPSHRITLGVLVESNYHSNLATRNLSRCSSLLCIAGGVGITACLPLIRTFGGVHSRLVWGVRSGALVRELESELGTLRTRGVELETSVGKRVNVRDTVREEMEREGDTGDLGVVVCGPNSMADEVRAAVAEFGTKGRRGVVLVDEGFSW
ncbi:hypothetical protein FA13DRAFT_1759168 [Coprinellus micaceus]|uniref:Ferric oxidoreductase domain-containing protein n=1 Tax=Coprinellus micaceus TaxID=71717 RepID=A0A4Y7S345_COPMI|nr:hypothetical protein FA13DRAFT_1759168 [Coprinellus micaceus]